MAVYVDDVRHPYRGMIMCHMWADSLEELMAMADRIGLDRKWFQSPPKASWEHFDISIGMKRAAIRNGAILTDRFAPLEHVARARGDMRLLERIRASRQRQAAAGARSPARQTNDVFNPQCHEGE